MESNTRYWWKPSTYLNLGTDAPFDELTEPWYLIQITADRIELVYEDVKR